MQYRKMKESGDRLSVLGFGCMRLPSKGRGGAMASIDIPEATKQLLQAIDGGVNYIDTAWPYHRGQSERFLGEHVLQNGYREKVHIATKLPCFSINKASKIDEIFNKQLEKLQVEYIDYYLLHALDGNSWEKIKSLGIIEWMDSVKRQGKVANMGFSFHGKYESFVKIIDEYDFDFAQVQYNILDVNFQAGIKGIEYASKKGLGIIVMEPLRGGSLARKVPAQVQQIYDTADVKRSPAEWALRWIYNNPAITVVLSGMNNVEHINENIRVASEAKPNSLTEKELKIIDDVRNKYQELLKVGCTGCAYCMPCPAGIDIPGSFNNLNNYHMFKKRGAILRHTAYSGVLTEDGKPHFVSSCIGCGQCESKCPQNIEIRKELKQVQRDLENPFLKTVAAIARPVVIGRKKNK